MLANKIRTKLLLNINKDLTNNNKNIVLINSYNPKDIQKNYLKDIDTIKLKSNLYHNSSKNNFLSTSFSYLETSDTTENDSFSNKEKNTKEFDFINKIKSKKNSSSFLNKKIIISQKKLNIKKLKDYKNKTLKNTPIILNEYNQNYYIKKLRNFAKTLILPKKRKGSLGYTLITKKLFKLFKGEIQFYESKTHSSLLNKNNVFNEINNEINFEEVKNAFIKANFILNDKNEIEIEEDLRHSYNEKNSRFNKEIFNTTKINNNYNQNDIIQLHKLKPINHQRHSSHYKNLCANKIKCLNNMNGNK